MKPPRAYMEEGRESRRENKGNFMVCRGIYHISLMGSHPVVRLFVMRTSDQSALLFENGPKQKGYDGLDKPRCREGFLLVTAEIFGEIWRDYLSASFPIPMSWLSLDRTVLTDLNMRPYHLYVCKRMPVMYNIVEQMQSSLFAHSQSELKISGLPPLYHNIELLLLCLSSLFLPILIVSS